MSATYEPGTVALIRVSSDYQPEIGIRGGNDKWYVAGPRLGSQHGWYEDHIEIVRPLVAIDPEDREQVELLLTAYHDQYPMQWEGDSLPVHADNMQAALRSLTRPPKPPEPTGKYAVVLDEDGSEWVRRGRDWCLFTTGPNHHKPGLGTTRRWEGVPAVRVLSEGVTQ